MPDIGQHAQLAVGHQGAQDGGARDIQKSVVVAPEDERRPVEGADDFFQRHGRAK